MPFDTSSLDSLDSAAVLKGIIVSHFVLTSFTLLGFGNDYLFYNSAYILLLFWSHRVRTEFEPIFFSLGVNGFGILMDVLVFATKYHSGLGGVVTFALVTGILNLLLRFISTVFLLRIYNERRQMQYQTWNDPSAVTASGPRVPGYEDFPGTATGAHDGANDTKPLPP